MVKIVVVLNYNINTKKVVKIMKKLLAIGLIGVMCLYLCGCNLIVIKSRPTPDKKTEMFTMEEF